MIHKQIGLVKHVKPQLKKPVQLTQSHAVYVKSAGVMTSTFVVGLSANMVYSGTIMNAKGWKRMSLFVILLVWTVMTDSELVVQYAVNQSLNKD